MNRVESVPADVDLTATGFWMFVEVLLGPVVGGATLASPATEGHYRLWAHGYDVKGHSRWELIQELGRAVRARYDKQEPTITEDMRIHVDRALASHPDDSNLKILRQLLGRPES